MYLLITIYSMFYTLDLKGLDSSPERAHQLLHSLALPCIINITLPLIIIVDSV